MEGRPPPTPSESEILSRVLLEEDFRSKFFENLESAVESYDLTNEELELLRKVPREWVDEQVKTVWECILEAVTFIHRIDN